MEQGGDKQIIQIIANLLIGPVKALIAMVKQLVDKVGAVIPGIALLMVLLVGGLAALRACAGDSDEAVLSSLDNIGVSTTAASTTTSTTTTTVPPTTTSTQPAPTTAVAVVAPVSPANQTATPTKTTVKAPSRKTKPTVAPATTAAPTTTVEPTTTLPPTTTTTTMPPTTTTIAPRSVTFNFLDEPSTPVWTDTQKNSTITDITQLTATDSTWVKTLPGGITQFTFRLYTRRNPDFGYSPTRLTAVVGATCSQSGINASSSMPNTNENVIVTCDATGSGPISMSLTYAYVPG